jgi:hypothetical protein
MSAAASMSSGGIALRLGRVVGALVGYGCLAGFVSLISLQVYRWFRLREWTHIGISEGLRSGLAACCVKDGDVGLLASLVHWIDAPVDWLGLHKVLEVMPASLALFALSILGNSFFIYCSDRIDARKLPT